MVDIQVISGEGLKCIAIGKKKISDNDIEEIKELPNEKKKGSALFSLLILALGMGGLTTINVPTGPLSGMDLYESIREKTTIHIFSSFDSVIMGKRLESVKDMKKCERYEKKKNI